MDNELVNKVTESGLITINLEDYYPREDVVEFDIKDYLFMGLILKEKDFREALKNIDSNKYKNKIVAVTCSADAIIPVWAYMLIASALQPIANTVAFGSGNDIKNKLLLQNITTMAVSDFVDKRIVIKGCGELPITEEAYLAATMLLRPIAKSIMYGEPCSTVPIFKKK